MADIKSDLVCLPDEDWKAALVPEDQLLQVVADLLLVGRDHAQPAPLYDLQKMLGRLGSKDFRRKYGSNSKLAPSRGSSSKTGVSEKIVSVP